MPHNVYSSLNIIKPRMIQQNGLGEHAAHTSEMRNVHNILVGGDLSKDLGENYKKKMFKQILGKQGGRIWNSSIYFGKNFRV